MTYRFASEADIETLAEWNMQLIADENHPVRYSRDEMLARWNEWLSGAYNAVIFSEEGREVAYALYRPQDGGIFLRQFFVARAARRIGVGTRAFELLRCEIWPGRVRITLDVLTVNPAGLRFWQSLGFREFAIHMELTDAPLGTMVDYAEPTG